MGNYYKNVIWTNHALNRMKERGLTQDMAAEAFHHPDNQFAGTQKDTLRYQKQFGKSKATVVAKKNEKNEWVILSAWVDPPLAGSHDEKRQNAYRSYQKAGFWKKVLITIFNQLGLRRY